MVKQSTGHIEAKLDGLLALTEERFGNVDEKLDVMSTNLQSLEVAVYGNGNMGLTNRVKRIEDVAKLAGAAVGAGIVAAIGYIVNALFIGIGIK